MANKKTIIGKTAPVPLGQQKAVNSLPVVFAEDQPPIPVEEQNKIQSEVALSLLGIPRAEVALGIFADVNTYDINPSEWSQFPTANIIEDGTGRTLTGLNHLAEEAGAELVAQTGKTTVLTSKRFFRYQPGRVSSSTMGVKMNTTKSTYADITGVSPAGASANEMKGAPSIKKWGIFDKFDGYYFEIVNGGDNNDFRCVRRTQALTYDEASGVETTGDGWNKIATSVVGLSNIKAGNWGVVGTDPVIFRNGLAYVAAAIYDPSLCYSPGDVKSIDDPAVNKDLNDFVFNEGYAVRLAYKNAAGTFVEHMQGRQYQFPFDQKEIDKSSAEYLAWKGQENNGTSVFLKPIARSGAEYIRLDAHCKWQDIITNLSRGGVVGDSGVFSPEIGAAGDAILANTGDARFNYDNRPSEASSGVKIWNLLVNVQGSTEISISDFQGKFGIDSHRDADKEYNTASTDPGRRNVTLKEWFNLCVPKEYRMVYEWRPVRAMFSGDQLNAKLNDVRWSDTSTGNVDPAVIGVKRPGDKITIDGAQLKDQSVYNIDFTKVTMWKIEFSWYGAVGALFLCYVPVANGEARWVRVHHMRASNQLDVASLGNATLPITYMTHGGRANGLLNGNKLVKYGASYYIDGGDKGTVRLLSKATDYPKSTKYGVLNTTVATAPVANSFEINASTQGIDEAVRDQLIGSYLKSETTTKVIWVENGTASGRVKLFFNRNVSNLSSGNSIQLVIPRRQRAMMALRAKDNVINTSGVGVRNRIQLYPIKYSLGVTDSSSNNNILSVNFIKNPLLITNNLQNLNLPTTIDTPIYTNNTQLAKGFELGSGTVPKEIISGTNISSGNYSSLVGGSGIINTDGKYFYAYMRSKPTNDVNNGFEITPQADETEMLVKLFNKGGKLYIQNYEAQATDVNVYGNLMYVKMYTFDVNGTIQLFQGQIGSNLSAGNHNKFENQKKWDAAEVGSWESIASLSGAKISQDFKLAPVANTGNNIFSIYANKGGDQYDLTDYFSYNKEYISFPLTNEVDILGIYAFWESSSGSPTLTDSINIVNSLTWEEQ